MRGFRRLLDLALVALGVNLVAGSLRTELPGSPADKRCDERKRHPVVVVGGGLAGLAASIEASRAGAEVFLLEKEGRIGGNSAKATSGINGALTPAQARAGTSDSFASFSADVLKSGGGRSSSELVEIIVRGSSEAVAWLESFGLDLSLLSHCGGHQTPRTHRIPAGASGRPVPVGWTTVQAVYKHVETTDEVQVLTGAHVTSLLTDNSTGRVSGVRYRMKDDDEGDVELPARAVVLATGGYAYDRSEGSLLSEFAPEHLHLATTSGPQATGDGVRFGQAAGAGVVDMDQIQVHPTSFVDPSDPTNLTKFLAPESMRGSGGILVDARGRRFANELATRAVLTNAVFEAGTPMPGGNEDQQSGGATPTVAFLIMNQEAADAFGTGMLEFYKSNNLIRTAENAAEAAKIMGHQDGGSALTTSMEAYTNVANGNGKDEFGKTVFPAKNFSTDQPLHIAIITPAIHYTMGGVRIDSDARVLGEGQAEGAGVNVSPIPGLFAAGEVTGGVHGVNRLAGNSLLECVVMGRLAGSNAAAVNESADDTCEAGLNDKKTSDEF